MQLAKIDFDLAQIEFGRRSWRAGRSRRRRQGFAQTRRFAGRTASSWRIARIAKGRGRRSFAVPISRPPRQIKSGRASVHARRAQSLASGAAPDQPAAWSSPISSMAQQSHDAEQVSFGSDRSDRRRCRSLTNLEAASLGRIAFRFGATERRITLVPLIKDARSESADRLKRSRVRFLLLGENGTDMPSPGRRVGRREIAANLGNSRRVTRAATNRRENQNEGLPQGRLLVPARIE